MSPYDQGYEDWLDGLELRENPYRREDRRKFSDWRQGWLASKNENSYSMVRESHSYKMGGDAIRDEAIMRGRKDARRGYGLHDNPYEDHTLANDWERGWGEIRESIHESVQEEDPYQRGYEEFLEGYEIEITLTEWMKAIRRTNGKQDGWMVAHRLESGQVRHLGNIILDK